MAGMSTTGEEVSTQCLSSASEGLAFMKYLVFPSQDMEHPVATVSNSDLEKAYLAYLAQGSDAQAATLKFQAGKHKYELDFKGTS